MPKKKEPDYLNGRAVEIFAPETYAGISCDLPKKEKLKILRKTLKELKDGKHTG